MKGAIPGAAYMVLVVWLQFVAWPTQSVGTLQTTLDHLSQHDAPLTYVLWQGGVTQPTCGAALTIVRKARQPRVGTAIAAKENACAVGFLYRKLELNNGPCGSFVETVARYLVLNGDLSRFAPIKEEEGLTKEAV